MWHLELSEMKAEVVVVALLTFLTSLRYVVTPPYPGLRSTIPAEIITKEFLGTLSFVIIFVIITK